MIRILISFLIVGNCFALTIAERVDSISKDSDLVIQMDLCGYKDANLIIFKRKLVSKKEIEKISCLESKRLEAGVELARLKARGARLDKAKKDIKETICNTLNGYIKNICIIRGGK